jgi:hypothetical protein
MVEALRPVPVSPAESLEVAAKFLEIDLVRFAHRRRILSGIKRVAPPERPRI